MEKKVRIVTMRWQIMGRYMEILTLKMSVGARLHGRRVIRSKQH